MNITDGFKRVLEQIGLISRNEDNFQITVKNDLPSIRPITIAVGERVRWTCRSADFRVLFSSAKCPFDSTMYAGVKDSICISGAADIKAAGKYTYTILVFTPNGLSSSNAELTVVSRK
jgi:hypothetical protein